MKVVVDAAQADVCFRPKADIGAVVREHRVMVECFYLQADEQMPEMADEDAWLLIEASNDGRFFGTGYGFNASGEGVFYASRPEDDTTLNGALAAAKEWAESRGVPRIWVQLSPHL